RYDRVLDRIQRMAGILAGPGAIEVSGRGALRQEFLLWLIDVQPAPEVAINLYAGYDSNCPGVRLVVLVVHVGKGRKVVPRSSEAGDRDILSVAVLVILDAEEGYLAPMGSTVGRESVGGIGMEGAIGALCLEQAEEHPYRLRRRAGSLTKDPH